VADKARETIQQYAADMFAVEAHIEEALDGQLKKCGEHPRASQAVKEFHRMVKAQREAMRAHVESIGGQTSGGIKGAVTNLMGKAAGTIDQVRTEAISRMLRDDYTAFNMAAIAYHMLDTTAHALGETATSEIAEKHLRAYANAVQQINQIISEVVVWELQKDEVPIKNPTAAKIATDELNEMWRNTSPGHTQSRAVGS